MTARGVALTCILVLLALGTGCGYRLVDYPNREDRLRVAVGNFSNETFEPGYEAVLADSLRREMAMRGAMQLVNDAGSADVVLGGRLIAVTTAGRSFNSVVSTLEFEVGVALDLEVFRPGTEIGFDRRMLRQREFYLASSDLEIERKNRSEAMRRISQVIAQRVHDVIWEVAPE